MCTDDRHTFNVVGLGVVCILINEAPLFQIIRKLYYFSTRGIWSKYCQCSVKS